MEDSVAPPAYLAAPLRLLPFHALSIAGLRVGEPATARAFARPYRKVPERLAQWRERGVLWRDADPALYLHEYTADGITVRGLAGALDLTRPTDDPQAAALFGHEGVHALQAAELSRRMAQMQLNPAPILLVHRATGRLRDLLRELRSTPPVLEQRDRAGQQHRLWALRAPEGWQVVEDELASTHALIADGHHRYGAYLRMQAAAPHGPADRGLVMLVDHDDTPLHLGAVHRVLPGVRLEELAGAAQLQGDRWLVGDRQAAVAGLEPGAMVLTDGTDWGVLRAPSAWDRTMVARLHEVVLPALPNGPARIDYHHTVEDTLAAAAGDAVAVLLPAPDLDEVQRIVESGRLLPEKATSFQPKPSVGVLMRSLLDG